MIVGVSAGTTETTIAPQSSPETGEGTFHGVFGGESYTGNVDHEPWVA